MLSSIGHEDVVICIGSFCNNIITYKICSSCSTISAIERQRLAHQEWADDDRRQAGLQSLRDCGRQRCKDSLANWRFYRYAARLINNLIGKGFGGKIEYPDSSSSGVVLYITTCISRCSLSEVHDCCSWYCWATSVFLRDGQRKLLVRTWVGGNRSRDGSGTCRWDISNGNSFYLARTRSGFCHLKVVVNGISQTCDIQRNGLRIAGQCRAGYCFAIVCNIHTRISCSPTPISCTSTICSIYS